MPPPAAVEYWGGGGEFPTRDGAPRLIPTFYILHDETPPEEWWRRCRKWLDGKSVWLYNSPNTAGLAARLRTMNPNGKGYGYLHWSALRGDPLFTVNGSEFSDTPLMTVLRSELALLSKPAPVLTTEQQHALMWADYKERKGL